MKNLGRALIAMTAAAALFVVPSIASAVSPELLETSGSTNTAVPVGSSIIATNVSHAATAQVTAFTTPITTVECTKATLTGKVTKNSGGIQGTLETMEFSNAGGVPCTSMLGETKVTPSHNINPQHNGISALPMCIATAAGDKITVRGGTCAEAARSVTFTLHTAIAGTCSYQRASLTATYTTHPADAVATVDAGQTFIKTTGSGFCPSEGTLDMAFTLTTDNSGTSGAALNIT